MMRIPSARRKKRGEERLNLVPIMDAVFVFIFFLLMSASFLRMMEIGSPIPIISQSEPPKQQKDPLALTLTMETNQVILSRGIPSRAIQKFPRMGDGEFNYEELHTVLVDLKKRHNDEDTIIFEPVGDLTYEEIVKFMDAVRMLRNTDEAIFTRGKDGLDVKIKELFNKIIFSNLMS
jgi:biopolymer transport protein ExbD